MAINSKPLVSAIIPCRNAEQWVGQAVESLLNQTYPNLEIIVVNNGSTDGTLEVLRGFGDKIRVYTLMKPGCGRARNRAADVAKGEWLQFLDADDYLFPDKIEKQMEHVHQHPDLDMVFGPITLEYWADGKVVNSRTVFIPEYTDDLWMLLALCHVPQMGSPLWKRSTLQAFGGHTYTKRFGHEPDLYFNLLKQGGKYKYLPIPGAVYRQWSDSTLCRKSEFRGRYIQMCLMTQMMRYLDERGELTPVRRVAFNRTRFMLARRTWVENKPLSRKLFRDIHRSDPDFKPPHEYAPPTYQKLYALGGCELAERVADIRRGLLSVFNKGPESQYLSRAQG